MSVVGSLGWKLVTTAVGIPVGMALSKSVAHLWITSRPHNPPREPTDPNVSWADAAGWAALSAAGVAVAQVVTTKGATTLWHALTGYEPPPVRKQAKQAEKAALKAAK